MVVGLRTDPTTMGKLDTTSNWLTIAWGPHPQSMSQHTGLMLAVTVLSIG
jgi:hypothetical protein